MTTRAIDEAVKVRAPHRTAAGTRWASGQVATSNGASTAESDTGATDINGTLVTLSLKDPAYLCFGVTSMGAAAVTDPYFPAGLYTFRLMPSERYFRAWGTATSVINWWISQP